MSTRPGFAFAAARPTNFPFKDGRTALHMIAKSARYGVEPPQKTGSNCSSIAVGFAA